MVAQASSPRLGETASRRAPSLGLLIASSYGSDGRPLLDTIREPYRRQILVDVLWSSSRRRAALQHGALRAGKENWKTRDLGPRRSIGFSHGQAPPGTIATWSRMTRAKRPTTLSLVKKLFVANPALAKRVSADERDLRKDGRGVLRILPARDVTGAHGKTSAIAGFDEIHSFALMTYSRRLLPTLAAGRVDLDNELRRHSGTRRNSALRLRCRPGSVATTEDVFQLVRRRLHD